MSIFGKIMSALGLGSGSSAASTGSAAATGRRRGSDVGG